MVQADRHSYLRSLAGELKEQSKRVRDLIGDKHWLSDGHHKEHLLAAQVRRHLPSGFVASRGFVVNPNQPTECSCEQDILIVDTQKEAPVFSQGDLVIAFPHTVVGAISVKTKISKESVEDTVRGLNSARQVCARDYDSKPIICAGFFYELDETVSRSPAKVYEYYKLAIDSHKIVVPPTSSRSFPPGPDILATTTDHLYRLHDDNALGLKETSWLLSGFTCNGLATGAFLAQILNFLAIFRGSRHSAFSEFATLNLDTLSPPNSKL